MVMLLCTMMQCMAYNHTAKSKLVSSCIDCEILNALYSMLSILHVIKIMMHNYIIFHVYIGDQGKNSNII